MKAIPLISAAALAIGLSTVSANAALYSVEFLTSDVIFTNGPGIGETVDVPLTSPTPVGAFTDTYLFGVDTRYNLTVTSDEPITGFLEYDGTVDQFFPLSDVTLSNSGPPYTLTGTDIPGHPVQWDSVDDCYDIIVSGQGTGIPYNIDIRVTSTPLPGAIWGFGAAIVGLGFVGWGRRSAKVPL